MGTLPSGTVTFLFTDIEDSTSLWEKYPEAMKSALAKHDSTLKEAVTSNSGQIIKTTGDGVHAVFSTAQNAIKASLVAQRELQTSEAPTNGETSEVSLRVRMGLHTGECQEREGDYYGAEVNRAARIMSVGHGGQILLSETTVQIVREHLLADMSLLDLGEHRLKGISKPERIFQLCHADLVNEFPMLKSLAAFKHNLTRQLSSFIGREKELAEVKRLLKESQLLTLLGPGGTGKTRLMLQVAEEVIEDYPDGVWLVELAPLADPDLIPERVAAALNVQEQPGRQMLDTLTEYLRRKELLLLLDNVEHIVQDSAEFTKYLLEQCPKLKILITGREALYIDGETTIQVPSLSMPEEEQTTEQIAKSEGVQLFLERARSVRPDFKLTEHNAVTIAEVVRRLDGIPLALELAAVRTRMMTVDQINERLNDRFRLLTGGRRTALPRQQTLQALIDWSWQLLDESEQVLLRRLSVFSGGWTLEAAQAVAGFDPLDEFDVFDNLDQVINKSLITVQYLSGEEARYGMLESIRQFSQGKLYEAGEGESLRDRHAEYYVAFTVRADAELYLKDAITWIDHLRRELDNQRAVITWTQIDRPELTLRLLGHLRHNRGHWVNPREAESWFNAVIPRMRSIIKDDSGEVDLPDYIRALLAFALNETVLGRNAAMREIVDEAVGLARHHKYDRLLAASIALKGLAYSFEMTNEILQEMEEAVQICRENGYQNELALNLMMLSGQYYLFGEFKKSERFLEEAKQIRLDLGSPLETALVAEANSGFAYIKRDWETARTSTEEAIEIFEKLNATQNLVMSQSRLGHILRQIGDIPGAEEIYRKTILAWQELGNIPAVAHQLECFAYLAIAKSDFGRSALLIGAASFARRRLNAPIENPFELADFEQAMAQLDKAMGVEGRDQVMAKGAKMSLNDAVALALKETA